VVLESWAQQFRFYVQWELHHFARVQLSFESHLRILKGVFALSLGRPIRLSRHEILTGNTAMYDEHEFSQRQCDDSSVKNEEGRGCVKVEFGGRVYSVPRS